MSRNTIVFDKDINPVVEAASREDLEFLVALITKTTTNMLDCNDVYKANTPHHEVYADLIAKEICEFGGNSFANLFRGHGPAYKEIVCDVANKLKAPHNPKNSIEAIEDSIIQTILEKALEKMTDEEKRQLLSELGDKRSASIVGPALTTTIIALFRSGGFLSYQILVIVVNAIAKTVLGHGLKFVTMAGITRVAAILTGPIGWAITGVWAIIDIAGPAYRVTIPAVVYIAMLRRKAKYTTIS